MESQKKHFQGQEYFDDRMFVLYLCKGQVEIEPGDDGAVWTRIFHENAPENHIWCVVTYRNCSRYPLYRVDSFNKREDAERYIKKIEPETPLVSLGGISPAAPLTSKEYASWKQRNNLKGYDWRPLYSADGMNASETVGQTKESFNGIA